MEVEFEFSIGKQNYRIIRKHARPKRRGASGQSSLNFQIDTGNGFSFTGRRFHFTDTAENYRRLTHGLQHFYQQCFPAQGHADEFTNSSPAKRKQVLTNILDLAHYDGFEAQAKDIVRQREILGTQLKISITDINRELEQKATCETELQQAQIELENIDKSLENQESVLKTLRQQKELLESKKAHLLQLEKNLAERTRTLTQWQEQIRQLRTRITEHEAVLARRAAIEYGYKRFVELKILNDTLNKNLALVNKLNERRHELEMFVQQEGQTLTKEHALLQNKVSELENVFRELPKLKESAQQTQLQLQHLAGEEQTLRNKREAYQEVITQIRSLEVDKKSAGERNR